MLKYASIRPDKLNSPTTLQRLRMSFALTALLCLILSRATIRAENGPRQVVVTDYRASGSVRCFYGEIKSTEASIRLLDPADFKDGEGIKIEHAGLPCLLGGLPCPSGPSLTVKAEGSIGSTSYGYQLAVLDEQGGMGPPGRGPRSRMLLLRSARRVTTWFVGRQCILPQHTPFIAITICSL